jgi:hypothetical protein
MLTYHANISDVESAIRTSEWRAEEGMDLHQLELLYNTRLL